MPTTIISAHRFLDLGVRRRLVTSGASIRWMTSATVKQTASSIASLGGTRAHHNHTRLIAIGKR
jgi:hypothetical protein